MGRVICCDLSKAFEDALSLPGFNVERLFDDASMVAALEQGDVEVVIIRSKGDDLPVLSFLRQLGERWPEVIRIQLSLNATARYITEAGDVAEASLPANCDTYRIEYAIEQGRIIRDRLSRREIQQVIEELGIPPLPSQVSGINALIDQQVKDSNAPVAPLFKGCIDYLKQLMALLNSPLFGYGRHLFSVNEAVRLVGLRAFRDVAIMAHTIHSFPQPSSWNSFSFEHQVGRALVCGRLAERIAHNVGADRVNIGAAFASGLLHDFGMRALVWLDPQKYHRTMEHALEAKKPVFAIEKLEFGVTHGELGAAILYRWGVSPRVVRAVLYHHVPTAAKDNGYSALTATHVADALLPPVFNAMGCHLGGVLSLNYLDKTGQMDKRSAWEVMGEDHRKQLEAHW